MSNEEKQKILEKYDSFLLSNSCGSCRPRERTIRIESAIDELTRILESLIEEGSLT